MHIHVFAALNDFMPAALELNTSSIKNIKGLRDALCIQYPAAEELLNACRFSTDKEILSLEQEISYYENIFVIPPSSGG